MARSFRADEIEFSDSRPVTFSAEEIDFGPGPTAPGFQVAARTAAVSGLPPGPNIPSPEAGEPPDIFRTAGRFLAEEGLPAALGYAGGMTGGIPGALVGGVAGRAIQRGVQAIREPLVEQPPGEVLLDVAKAGGLQALTRGAEVGLTAVGKKLAPGAIKLGAQLLRAGPGIKEKTGQAALSDLGLLSRAMSVKEAGNLFEKTISAAGIKTGPQALKKVTGKLIVGQEKKLAILDDSMRALDAGFLPTQEAIVAREQASKLLQAAKFGDPAMASEKRELVLMIERLDDFLEPRVKGYASARKAYREAKVAEEFSSLLPLNKNLSPNVLRTIAAVAAAGTGAYAGEPGIALIAPLAVSPAVAGVAIRAAAGVSRAGAMALQTRLPQAAARLGVPSLADYYSQARQAP